MENNKNRFSDKSDDYAKYRPSYPMQILQFLKDYNFSNKSIIADIGTGTLTKIFTENGNNVYAVEPNDNMRGKANSLLNMHKNYFSINGTAEDTTLENNSIDFIVVGTAFHWFDISKALNEFKRILIKAGVLVLLWNDIKYDTAFMKEYHMIKRKFSNNSKKDIRNDLTDEEIQHLYLSEFKKITLENNQELTLEELVGRF